MTWWQFSDFAKSSSGPRWTLVGQIWDVGMFDNPEFDPDKDAIKVKKKYQNILILQ